MRQTALVCHCKDHSPVQLCLTLQCCVPVSLLLWSAGSKLWRLSEAIPTGAIVLPNQHLPECQITHADSTLPCIIQNAIATSAAANNLRCLTLVLPALAHCKAYLITIRRVQHFGHASSQGPDNVATVLRCADYGTDDRDVIIRHLDLPLDGACCSCGSHRARCCLG